MQLFNGDRRIVIGWTHLGSPDEQGGHWERRTSVGSFFAHPEADWLTWVAAPKEEDGDDDRDDGDVDDKDDDGKDDFLSTSK